MVYICIYSSIYSTFQNDRPALKKYAYNGVWIWILARAWRSVLTSGTHHTTIHRHIEMEEREIALRMSLEYFRWEIAEYTRIDSRVIFNHAITECDPLHALKFFRAHHYHRPSLLGLQWWQLPTTRRRLWAQKPSSESLPRLGTFPERLTRTQTVASRLAAPALSSILITKPRHNACWLETWSRILSSLLFWQQIYYFRFYGFRRSEMFTNSLLFYLFIELLSLRKCT